MSNLAALHPQASLSTLDASSMQALVSGGDCSKLSPDQRTAYYVARCEAAGLDPRAQPFAFTNLSGKLVLYALKAASDQLAAKHKVRLAITDQRTEEGIRVVTVRAEAADGRVTEEIGALPVKGLQGEALSNALMKTVTKAKRRAILSLCGLGALDETEVESIPGAHHQEPVQQHRPQELEVSPPPAPLPTVHVQAPQTPKHVLAMWTRLLEECEGDKSRCQAELGRAATLHWGTTVPPKHLWTVEDCAALLKAATAIEELEAPPEEGALRVEDQVEGRSYYTARARR